MKPTCIFPSYSHKVLKAKDVMKKGDLFNYRNPMMVWCDYWQPIKDSVGKPVSWFGKGWVIIRPL